MAERYIVTLTSDERNSLEKLTKTGKHDSRTVILGRALLLCDKGSTNPKPMGSKAIGEALGISDRTIERMKKKFVTYGLEEAIERKPMEPGGKELKFDGAFEARIMALACTEAPSGRSRWTVRLLAEKAVELEIVDSVSAMTIQRILKKTKLNLTSRNIGRSPRTTMGNL
jgi:hypothetical protein